MKNPRLAHGLAVLCMLGWAKLGAAKSEPPTGPACQDPSLNQLVHAEGYKTAPLGTLGRVELTGHGPRDVVLIPGFGHGAEIFRSFVESNGDHYRMLLVTPSGIAGTPAPPMPVPSESYCKRTWCLAFERAVWEEIQRRKLNKPVLMGFEDGLQSAFRIALDHPDGVGPIVSIAGEPVREFDRPTPPSMRAKVVDEYLAKAWFKTVTAKTWRDGMGTPAWYSDNADIGTHLFEASLTPTIPAMVRYFCERWSYDPRPELKSLETPILALLPDEAASPADEAYRKFLKCAIVGPWDSVCGNCTCETVMIRGSRLGMLVDHTKEVSREVARFLAKH